MSVFEAFVISLLASLAAGLILAIRWPRRRPTALSLRGADPGSTASPAPRPTASLLPKPLAWSLSDWTQFSAKDLPGYLLCFVAAAADGRIRLAGRIRYAGYTYDGPDLRVDGPISIEIGGSQVASSTTAEAHRLAAAVFDLESREFIRRETRDPAFVKYTITSNGARVAQDLSGVLRHLSRQTSARR